MRVFLSILLSIIISLVPYVDKGGDGNGIYQYAASAVSLSVDSGVIQSGLKNQTTTRSARDKVSRTRLGSNSGPTTVYETTFFKIYEEYHSLDDHGDRDIHPGYGFRFIPHECDYHDQVNTKTASSEVNVNMRREYEYDEDRDVTLIRDSNHCSVTDEKISSEMEAKAACDVLIQKRVNDTALKDKYKFDDFNIESAESQSEGSSSSSSSSKMQPCLMSYVVVFDFTKVVLGEVFKRFNVFRSDASQPRLVQAVTEATLYLLTSDKVLHPIEIRKTKSLHLTLIGMGYSIHDVETFSEAEIASLEKGTVVTNNFESILDSHIKHLNNSDPASDVEYRLNNHVTTMLLSVNLTSVTKADYADIMDHYLEMYPWWQVHRELHDRDGIDTDIYADSNNINNINNNNSNSNINSNRPINTSNRSTDRVFHEVSFRRVHTNVEPLMKFLNYISFPDSYDKRFNDYQGCFGVSQTIKTSGMIHPGWFSHIAAIEEHTARRPFGSLSLFWPNFATSNFSETESMEARSLPHINLDTHSDSGGNAYMSPGDCVHDSSGDAGTNVNLWACAFLRSTHCPLPTVVTEPELGDWVRNMKTLQVPNTNELYFRRPNDISKDAIKKFYDSLDANAITCHKEGDYEKCGRFPADEASAQLFSQAVKMVGKFRYVLPVDPTYVTTHSRWDYTMLNPQSHEIRKYALPQGTATPFVLSGAFVQYFILRKSYFYRSQIVKMINHYRHNALIRTSHYVHNSSHSVFAEEMQNNRRNLRRILAGKGNGRGKSSSSSSSSSDGRITADSHYFSEKDKCVAVHMRRGDRTMYNQTSGRAHDMMQWCYNSSHPFGSRLCLSGDNQLHPCLPSEEDLGCYNIPFGSVTLEDIVQKVSVLVGPHIKTLVVTTDDPLWLHAEANELKKKDPSWNVLSLPEPTIVAPPSDSGVDGDAYRGYTSIRSSGGSKSGLYLFASLKLMQQCDAFIGHFGSGMAFFIYQAMCLEHGSHKLRNTCPPVYDFRFGRTAITAEDKESRLNSKSSWLKWNEIIP